MFQVLQIKSLFAIHRLLLTNFRTVTLIKFVRVYA